MRFRVTSWIVQVSLPLNLTLSKTQAQPRSGLSLITYHLSLLSLPGGDEDGGTVVRDTYGQTGVRTEVGQSLYTGKIKTQT